MLESSVFGHQLDAQTYIKAGLYLEESHRSGMFDEQDKNEKLRYLQILMNSDLPEEDLRFVLDVILSHKNLNDSESQKLSDLGHRTKKQNFAKKVRAICHN